MLDELRVGVLEEQAIVQALSQTKGNKVQAAKLLGMSRSTLYRKLARLPPSRPAESAVANQGELHEE